MFCRGCSCWAVSYRVTSRSPDGQIESANYCHVCYQNLINGLPTYQPFTNLIVTLILAVLDTLLVCIATAPWFVIGGLSPRFVLAPIINGPAIGILLAFQMGLLWRVRGKAQTKTVIAAAKLKSDPPQKHLWDRELDG
jgi:hypothetical protein